MTVSEYAQTALFFLGSSDLKGHQAGTFQETVRFLEGLRDMPAVQPAPPPAPEAVVEDDQPDYPDDIGQ